MQDAAVGFNPKDRFFHKAKAENFAARSVYKLQEIDKKHRLLRTGQWVLDLGASPGSWSQWASQKIGPTGRVVGVDLKPVTVSLGNALFFEGDLFELAKGEIDSPLMRAFAERGVQQPFDLVLSDMAPSTTGIKSVDQARSSALCELALDCALRWLKPGGSLVVKFFQSGDYGELRESLRKSFEKVDTMKPESTRSISKEIFLIALKLKASQGPSRLHDQS